MPATVRLEHLEPVHELNRSFLGFLQSRARVERDCLGLPATAHPPLRAADGTLLDNVAQFPRALFQVRCDGVVGAEQELAAVGERDAAVSRARSVDPLGRAPDEPPESVPGAVSARPRRRADRVAAIARAARPGASGRCVGHRALRVHRPGLAVARHSDRHAARVAAAARARCAATRARSRLAASGDPRIRSPDTHAQRSLRHAAASAFTIAARGARAPALDTNGRVSHQGPAQGLRQRRGSAERHRPHGTRGRFLRAARPERRRQDHDDRHHHVADPQNGRLGPGVWARSRHRARGREGLHRRGAAGDQPEHVRAQRPHADQPGGVLRRARERGARAHREVPEGAAPLGKAPRHRAHAVGRHEAPAHDRARARPRAAPPDPRRANGRRRHRDPPLDVGVHARDQRGRRHDHPDDALPRRSREPVPEHRDHRRRSGSSRTTR